MIQYQLACDDPEKKSREVSILRGRDGKGTIYAYGFTDQFIIVNEGDFQGLALAEIKALEEYTKPIEEQ